MKKTMEAPQKIKIRTTIIICPLLSTYPMKSKVEETSAFPCSYPKYGNILSSHQWMNG
jgi:hypothetical protein